jgi:hypothetical protein
VHSGWGRRRGRAVVDDEAATSEVGGAHVCGVQAEYMLREAPLEQPDDGVAANSEGLRGDGGAVCCRRSHEEDADGEGGPVLTVGALHGLGLAPRTGRYHEIAERPIVEKMARPHAGSVGGQGECRAADD